MIETPSPNQDERPPGTPIDTLVLHYTGMQTAAAALERLRDPAAHVSSHYVLDEDGTLFQLVPEHRRAFHAGVSYWRGNEALNGRSIGIEIVNPGHEWGYRDFPPPQIDALIALCRGIMARHPISPLNVVGHSDIAPDRKQDPGERFPWPALAAAGIGLWPEDTGRMAEASEAEGVLQMIGYPVPDLRKTLTAFQRRWRPAAVTGEADPGTRARLAAVLGAFVAHGLPSGVSSVGPADPAAGTR